MSYPKSKIQEIIIKAKNENHSFEEIVQLAALNNSYYQYVLGTYFDEGYYVERNTTEAKEWYQRSGENGYHLAYYRLAKILWCEGKYDESLSCYLFFCEKKGENAEAQYAFGLAYLFGLGSVKQNFEDATKHFILSAQIEIRNNKETKIIKCFEEISYGIYVNNKEAEKIYEMIINKLSHINNDESILLKKIFIDSYKEWTDGSKGNKKDYYEELRVVQQFKTIDKKAVALHEIGHAIAGLCFYGEKFVEEIIVRDDGSGGETKNNSFITRYLNSKIDYENCVIRILCGKAAEEVYDCFSVGISDDLQRCTSVVRSMIVELGYWKYKQHMFYFNDEDDFWNKLAKLPVKKQNEIIEYTDKMIQEKYNEAIEFIKNHKKYVDMFLNELVKNNYYLSKKQISLLWKKVTKKD